MASEIWSQTLSGWPRVTDSDVRMVFMGEVTAAAHPDYEAIARRVIRDIGYDKPGVGFDANSCRVSVNLHTCLLYTSVSRAALSWSRPLAAE